MYQYKQLKGQKVKSQKVESIFEIVSVAVFTAKVIIFFLYYFITNPACKKVKVFCIFRRYQSEN